MSTYCELSPEGGCGSSVPRTLKTTVRIYILCQSSHPLHCPEIIVQGILLRQSLVSGQINRSYQDPTECRNALLHPLLRSFIRQAIQYSLPHSAWCNLVIILSWRRHLLTRVFLKTKNYSQTLIQKLRKADFSHTELLKTQFVVPLVWFQNCYRFSEIS